MAELPDEDDVLDLPPLPPTGAGEEAGPEGDLDDDDDDAWSEDESVGLDDAVGGPEAAFDDPIEIIEELAGATDEPLAPLDIGDAIEDANDDEYGWTGDDTLGRLDDFLEAEAEPELAAADDRGEEGVEDAPTLSFEGEDAVVGLPPLDPQESDDLADDLELDDDAEIDLDRMPSEEDSESESEGS